MKKGFSLIETIFTVVLLGIIMLSIPKLFSIYNSSNEFSKRQDGIYNNISFLKIIKNNDWDNKLNLSNDIIQTSNGNPLLNCNNFRVNGFESNRRCENNYIETAIGLDGELDKNDYNDIDDWNNYTLDIEWNSQKVYEGKVLVSWFDDNIFNYDYLTNSVELDLSTAAISNNTNIKKINVYTTGTNSNNEKFLINNLNYYSANIGKVILETRNW